LGTTGGLYAGIIGKYNSAGSLLWTSRIDGTRSDYAITVSASADNGVLVGGEYSSTQLNFYATNGSSILYTLGNLTTNGNFTGLVAKYDSVGNLLWATRMDSVNNDTVNTITTSPDGFYFGGQYTSTQVSFYNGNGQIVSSMGGISGNVGFIAKYIGSTTGAAVATIDNSVTFSTAGVLAVTGSVQVTGNLSVSGAKNFQIPHPIPEKRADGYVLRHSAIETPTRGDNMYRYQITTTNSKSCILLPDYFPFLNEDIYTWCQAIEHFGMAYAKYNQEINCIDVSSNIDGDYYIYVIGTRKDADALKYDTLGNEFKL
jgi:hypothetical protein